MMRSVTGDIGGVIIRNSGISRADEQRIKEINDNWTGVHLAHLQKYAAAAHGAGFSPKRPGVVLLAPGRTG